VQLISSNNWRRKQLLKLESKLNYMNFVISISMQNVKFQQQCHWRCKSCGHNTVLQEVLWTWHCTAGSTVDMILYCRKYSPSDMASQHRRIQNFHVMINWNWRHNLILTWYYNNIQVSKYYIFFKIVMVMQVEAKALKRKINQIYGQ
jgi:hypothetical protein